MNKPTLLIWSYNRASQADLLLQTVEKFCPNQFDVNILFKASGDFFKGYELLIGLHPTVKFIQEYDFNFQTKQLLKKSDYTAVSTDDTVIFRPFIFKEQYMSGVDVFSLRYGLNTVIQDPFNNIIQPALYTYHDEGDTISWNTMDYHPLNNYGFIFGHDMHIYSRKYSEIVEYSPFKKANELESWLFNNGRDKINPFIRSFKHSVAVNLPSNNTSGITQTDNSLPLEETNKKFLDGYRFRLREIEKMKVEGCHKLVDLYMVK